ncbi:putative membrane protein [Yersinia pestis PY-13]|uniref:Uncharacterized protein n=2 Tax=Yersinia pestis TaxID=632 RepID=A0AAV3B960_YERPE|nr:hypothetical protein YPIP275_4007 [Yersinia pestis biovar Orientalis str. IP275]EDR41890.1 hypothetical protein YpE1979001_3615 [Yersinia pestis biovar Antiqua str. E1979001]EDR59873.1 hypothetical protein YpUG050454_4560 [Yersinia pestis biovar Antiqua str. UG05-0454]EIQ95898.1 putative membrane protein [Yersinia pestis PY-02]EIQ96094.1 putative membrane protein [Yersinia pestis PY-01]EIQ99333.1 putative membrane protein [Yersinia pestis PY-03]EIR10139.1 putative membrane protein [Yersini
MLGLFVSFFSVMIYLYQLWILLIPLQQQGQLTCLMSTQ